MLRYARWTASGLLGLIVGVGSLPLLWAVDETAAPPAVTQPTIDPAGAAQAADSPADATDAPVDPAAEQDAASVPAAVDVTALVQVRLTGTLLSNTKGVLSTGVVVENTSAEAIAGPLVVVVDQTGIAGLEFAANDGDLPTGEHCVKVLSAKGTLKAGAKTASQRIEFTSAERVPAEVRKTFAPTFRVLRAEPVDKPQALQAADELLPGKSYSQARLDAVMAIQTRGTAKLLENPAVFGTATGEDEQGNLVIIAYTQRTGIAKELPGSIEGVPLETEVTGTMFRAGPAWATGPKPSAQANSRSVAEPTAAGTVTPTDPTIRFDRPVPIGVSMGNFADGATGTLGCRVVFADGRLGILTNSHVGSRNGIPAVVVNNPLTGVTGDPWVQPGRGDYFSQVPDELVATLQDHQAFTGTSTLQAPFSPLQANVMDASVGLISGPDLVQACTPDDGYGFPSRTPVAPTLGTRVLKYGRTTGLREGKLRGLNANVRVGTGTGGTTVRQFIGQLVIYGDDRPFGAPGDSGSLIVTEQGHHPVGLLFAGSGFQVLANPIQPVLQRFNIAIDDGSGTPPSTTAPRADGRMGTAAGRIVP